MSEDRARAYWAGHFGVSPEVFLEPGTHFVPHAALGDYDGVWVFRRGPAVVVSAPAAKLAEVGARLGDVADEALDGRDLLAERLARPAEAVIGPAWWGRLDPEAHRPMERAGVRPLQADDAPALARFRDRCWEDWATSSIDPERMPMQVAFDGGELVAVAPWRNRGAAGDPCLVTAPEQRGRGWSSAACSALCADALARGDLVLYQTLESNAPAIAVARRLGFVRDAGHVAVRLGSGA